MANRLAHQQQRAETLFLQNFRLYGNQMGKNKSKNISYYFATSTGYMYTGLKTINQKNYYFKSNGVMAVSTFVTVNGIIILHRSRRSGYCEDYQTKCKCQQWKCQSLRYQKQQILHYGKRI